jgi:hypothetical protein
MGIKSNQVDALIGTADVHLNYISTTQIALAGLPGTTQDIEVGGYTVDCSTPIQCLTTDNLITSAGLDYGSPPAVSTLYYAYVSNPAATFAPSDLRLAGAAPNTSNGYLGTTGNALNWRYVGMVYTNNNGGVANFSVGGNACLVSSHYNRQEYLVSAAYDDVSHTYGTGTWRLWNNSTSGRIHYLVPYNLLFATAWVKIRCFVPLSTPATGTAYVAIYANGASAGLSLIQYISSTATLYQTVNGIAFYLPAPGYYYQDLYEYATTVSSTYYGTNSQNQCLCWY